MRLVQENVIPCADSIIVSREKRTRFTCFNFCFTHAGIKKSDYVYKHTTLHNITQWSHTMLINKLY